ncbi:GL18052 [Drosophila persimilis]|uniref:GL18052 n=1 Tax=Drosophila persimilis TaxID=7234 RepID=B4HAJ2_DROPE|nr:peptidoglycan-recognition protein LE isoform X1 [Drosophila persimilis]EDW37595.1 GL18052 [Drosophila persimilis]
MSNVPISAAVRSLSEERTREWLEAQSAPDEDEVESIAESSVVDSLDYEYSEYTQDEDDEDNENTGEEISTMPLGTSITNKRSKISDTLRDLMNSINSIQTVGNVNISNSTNVHIGNVTNINGNIQIIANSLSRARHDRRKTSLTEVPAPDIEPNLLSKDESEERVCSDVFINSQKFKIPKELCSIIPRHSWLAQSPMEEPEVLQRPVKYVVILHTATESSEKRAINVRLIRDMQCFHIESRRWNDIAYNFLIGCDGNIYEGRGWRTVGAHTLGYNKIALGISFIGCFMRELPTTDALNMCRNLLARGVEDGHIASDYRLICHCQCNSTESPGRRLYEEIQAWPHFYNIEKEKQ